MTAAITPVTPATPIGVMPQGGTVSSAQQITVPIGGNGRGHHHCGSK